MHACSLKKKIKSPIVLRYGCDIEFLAGKKRRDIDLSIVKRMEKVNASCMNLGYCMTNETSFAGKLT